MIAVSIRGRSSPKRKAEIARPNTINRYCLILSDFSWRRCLVRLITFDTARFVLEAFKTSKLELGDSLSLFSA